ARLPPGAGRVREGVGVWAGQGSGRAREDRPLSRAPARRFARRAGLAASHPRVSEVRGRGPGAVPSADDRPLAPVAPTTVSVRNLWHSQSPLYTDRPTEATPMIELRPRDPRYPALLGAIAAPPSLYVRGEIQDDDSLALAIVGSRRPTPY